MYKEKSGNVEVYFICYKKEGMDLVETYYDEILDVHCWYFNAYLAYKYWKNKFKKIVIDEVGRMLLTVGASRYILYNIDEFQNDKFKKKRLVRELEEIAPKLQNLLENNKILLNM